MSHSAAAVPFRVERGVAGTRFLELRHFAEVDSTNRYLLDEARAGAPEGLVAVADHQTAGRGRLGRRWEAPRGSNLLASVLLRPALAVDELHLCTVVVALAARTACALVAAVAPELKWPNDLIVGERKLAGVLAESVPGPPVGRVCGAGGGAGGGGSGGDGGGGGGGSGGAGGGAARAADTAGAGRAVVVGLGLNVDWPPPDGESGVAPVPEELAAGATSLWRETGRRAEIGRLVDVLLGDLEGRLRALAHSEGRRRQTSEYRSACATLGQVVTVSLPGETFTGSVLDITVDGHLLVEAGTSIRTITAADVVHLRARS
jgi:BirA family biotin operon repressor/biotin-[acetyl-CoA-carboxylase] ligase